MCGPSALSPPKHKQAMALRKVNGKAIASASAMLALLS